jgi:tripartite-type tricarboxylate transporter receptor subunit TctC
MKDEVRTTLEIASLRLGRCRLFPAAVFLAVTVQLAAVTVVAAEYPARPIRVVVPYPPGGGADIVLRAIGPAVSARLGQQVVVDNRGGATGIIGSELVARAAPDGYTLLFHTSAGLAIVPNVNKSLPFDPIRDFAPVMLATSSPYMLVVHPKLPVTSVPQLIALARARPRELNFASSGNGSSTHLAGALLNKMAGVQLVHVPYKGAGPAVADVVAGHIQLRFSSIPPAMPHVKSGRLRALAVTGAQRFSLLPDLPAVAETLPGFQVDSWNGVLAPAGTPAAVIQKLNTEMVAVLRAPEIKALLESSGVEPVGSSPEHLGQVLREELARWAPIVKEAGARAE